MSSAPTTTGAPPATPPATLPHGTAGRDGFLAGLAASIIWGAMPLYFHAVGNVPPLEMIAHRILWSLLLILSILALRGSLAELRAVLASRRLLMPLVGSAILIAANWLIYIWAVQHQHVIAASLGYFLNPIINVLLGFAVLRERLSRWQWAAVAIVIGGVAILAAGALSTAWISISLALSFGFYGLIRKMAPTGPLVGLAAETLLLAPIAFGAILWWSSHGQLAFAGAPLSLKSLLVFSGPLTTVPLVLFAYGAQRLTMATLGLLQYVGPTIQLAMALFLFDEPLTQAHKIAIPVIWCGLALYSWSVLRRRAAPPIPVA